jgi:hypothetical protein
MPGIYRRLPAYASLGIFGFIFLAMWILPGLWSGIRTSSPIRMWTAAAFAVGCTAPLFSILAWRAADRGLPRARSWLRGAAVAILIYIASPATLLAAFGALAVPISFLPVFILQFWALGDTLLAALTQRSIVA